jgi:hypothetical protein
MSLDTLRVNKLCNECASILIMDDNQSIIESMIKIDILSDLKLDIVTSVD